VPESVATFPACVVPLSVSLGGSASNKRKRHLEVSMNSHLFLAEANKLLPFDSLWGNRRHQSQHISTMGMREAGSSCLHLKDRGRPSEEDHCRKEVVITSESGCSMKKVTDFCSTPKVDAL
jgi:hypothetical protein